MAPERAARAVRVHDFIIPTKGKAIPYGVYDLTRIHGRVHGWSTSRSRWAGSDSHASMAATSSNSSLSAAPNTRRV